MEKKKTLPLLLLVFSFFKSISGADDCQPASCSPTGPQVRFPFRIRGKQSFRCGFPGFDLSCNNQSQTVIRLQSTGTFVVNRISYDSQVVYIDPQFCRQQDRISYFDLSGTPFEFSNFRSYTFYNCTTQSFGYMYPAVSFPCLSGANFSVIAVRTGVYPPGEMPASCKAITTVNVPIRWDGDIRSEMELMWSMPLCRNCEIEGKTCGFKGNDGDYFLEIGCSGPPSREIPRAAKYGLSIGIGVPAFICIIGLVCYTATKVRDYNQSNHHQSIDLFSIAITPQPPSSTGLDGPTIESYPKTVLGESGRLPKAHDGTCPICLSDYEPKEALRTIPECNHYFHADCIDEWLKLNATCPVCRNSPESSSLVTPCSSILSASTDSS